MTKKYNRQIGIFFLNHFGKSALVFNQRIPAAAFAEITEVIVALYGFTVADMVVNQNGKALFAEKTGKFFVSFAVLRHAVNYLKNSLWRLGSPTSCKNICNTGFGRNGIFFSDYFHNSYPFHNI